MSGQYIRIKSSSHGSKLIITATNFPNKKISNAELLSDLQRLCE